MGAEERGAAKAVNLSLKRDPTTPEGTFGKLSVDGVYDCETLEDEVREVEGQSVKEWKISGETAIPRGRYRVLVTWSPRFKRELPLLIDVPGFDGVRIHAGNTEFDTEGCILVGQGRKADRLIDSRVALAELIADIDEALRGGEECWIEIT